ncbi:MAG TPA: HEAT repeat domain-containing protein [Polyangiaceae bacterium]|nr:HEAT repeat domain-containing protein [Polyangiaceae bacterium]
MTFKITSLVKSSVVLGTLLLSAGASADEPNITRGRAEVYKQLSPESLETISTREQISKLDAANLAPTRIWKVLEHGEKLECLACVPVVSKLLYNSQPKTREIAAWWLRRRIFGVFGPGQVYEQTVSALGNKSETESHRVYAANALGEFLSTSGVPALSKAALGDESALVRAAAVSGLERLNSSGASGELTGALGDSDETVRLAALHATTHINSFTDVEAVVALIGDSSSLVRRRAAEALGVMKAADAVAGLIALASADQESDAQVRTAAIWALGQIGDPAAREVIRAAQQDADVSVHSAANVSARLLRL